MSRKKVLLTKKTKNKIKRNVKKVWKKHGLAVCVSIVLLLFSLMPNTVKFELLQMLPASNLQTEYSIQLEEVVGQYSGEPYVILNDNEPLFTEADVTTDAYESYASLDWLGRCGTAMACVGTELMPTEERGNIGQVKPSGWHTVKYDIVDGKYLYNRCHLIGYQLSGENANERNLITGTRYMNVKGMLPFEDMVAAYVKYTGNHVLYRVTPIYENTNLVAHGVTIEGYSVEDAGAGICFYVYVHNVQPGIGIDYATGESWLIAQNSK